MPLVLLEVVLLLLVLLWELVWGLTLASLPYFCWSCCPDHSPVGVLVPAAKEATQDGCEIAVCFENAERGINGVCSARPTRQSLVLEGYPGGVCACKRRRRLCRSEARKTRAMKRESVQGQDNIR